MKSAKELLAERQSQLIALTQATKGLANAITFDEEFVRAIQADALEAAAALVWQLDYSKTEDPKDLLDLAVAEIRKLKESL